MFITAIDYGYEAAVSRMPKNLKQYYANQLMLMRVCVEFGVANERV